jgi:hypothetical protein
LLEVSRPPFIFRVARRQFAVLPDHAIPEDNQERTRQQHRSSE